MSENTSRKRSRGRTGIYNAFRSSLSSSLSLTVVLYGLVISLTCTQLTVSSELFGGINMTLYKSALPFFSTTVPLTTNLFKEYSPLFAVGSALVPLPQVCKLGLCEGVCAAAPSDYWVSWYYVLLPAALSSRVWNGVQNPFIWEV